MSTVYNNLTTLIHRAIAERDLELPVHFSLISANGAVMIGAAFDDPESVDGLRFEIRLADDPLPLPVHGIVVDGRGYRCSVVMRPDSDVAPPPTVRRRRRRAAEDRTLS